MMKIEPAVKAETQRIAIGTVILTALMVAVFLVIHQFDLTVLWGALLGCVLAIGNFFLMALGVQREMNNMPVIAPDGSEEETEDDSNKPVSDEARQAGKRMQFFFFARMLIIGAIAAVALSQGQLFHPIALLVPLLFPSAVIMFIRKAGNGRKEV